MCNLYNITTTRDAVMQFTKAFSDKAGWNEPSLDVYPGYQAPRRTEDRPLSDCSNNHIALSHTRKGSFVACRGVCVVTVNWNRQSPLEH